nr:13830_t:CDS:2 [Entrophospora candida]
MLTTEAPEQLQFLQLQQQQQQTHPAPQMFDAFHQSPHGEFKPTFYNPFEVKHRRRTSRQQLKVLEKAFNENPKPHAAVRQALAQKLSMTPRGVQVWFQNRHSNDALSTISSPNADDSLENYYCGTANSTTKSRPKPNIDPLKTSWQTQEEYDLMVQRRQFEQFGPKYNTNNHNNDWMHSNLSSATTVGSDYIYDHIIPLSTPASAVTISDCFTEYTYSPVSSVISDNKDGNGSIASSSDSLNPTAYARRNSCPELMASILNLKLGGPPDEKRSLSTIIEDEALSNDPSMHQFLAVPTQFKRRFSEPINRYNFSSSFSGFNTEVNSDLITEISNLNNNTVTLNANNDSLTTNTTDTTNAANINNTPATTIPQNHASFPFNLHTILTTNQQNDHHPLLRNNNVWPSATSTANHHHHNLKERQMWNFQLDFKQQTKLPINSTMGLKNANATSINVTHWNTLPSSNVDNSTINSNMTIPITDDMSFMHHYYETSNDQVYIDDTIILPETFNESYEGESLDFLVVGDWGSAGKKDKNSKNTTQINVAKSMEHFATMHDSKFIVNVGDNFYKRFKNDYQGINSVDDPKWEDIWLNVYNGPKLSKLTWYSVAGNHDWYSNITAQVDYSLNKNSRFFLPSLFYVRRSVFGKEPFKKTETAWIHIDTNVFAYDVNEIVEEKMQGLKTNLLAFGWHKKKIIEKKFKWIEDRLIENQDAKWIFVVGHHSLIGSCSSQKNLPRLLKLLEHYRVSAYFSGHNHVLQYKSPDETSPFAKFVSGAGSKFGYGCDESDWMAMRGTVGFLHVKVTNNDLQFEFIDSTNATRIKKKNIGKIAYSGKLVPF